MNNLIILATYWNEKQWIRTSLDQIKLLEPAEVIICDGNFDPKVPNYSTDGTSKSIREFQNAAPFRVEVINAIRLENTSLLGKFYALLTQTGCNKYNNLFNLGRLVMAMRASLRTNIYRINQALTFAHMARKSEYWRPGYWVMTLDADQFYSDEILKLIPEIINGSNPYELITANELTFPHDFYRYTDQYEKRIWNNMPHKISSNMAIYPTRHLFKEFTMISRMYIDCVKAYKAGFYFHYKFRDDLQRSAAGYQLGDREPPRAERYSDLISLQDLKIHPKAIKANFDI